MKGAVTIATNMAGRGTDIKLTPEVKAAGGLAIIGTERHESRRAFKPYRLPDSALRGVPYSRAVQRLFAAALIAGIAGIGNGNVYAVFADDYVVGDVKRKWIVSAFVRAHVLAVDVNFRDIIHRAEVQNDATFYKLFGKVEFPFVIQKVVGHNDAFNPRKLARPPPLAQHWMTTSLYLARMRSITLAKPA